MNISRTRIAIAVTTAAAAGLVATPLVLLAASPASADSESHVRCGAGTLELDVDRERGGYEVSVDLDGVRTGSPWKVKLTHDGKVVTTKVHHADRDGEVELDRWRPDTRGSDTFRVKATNLTTKAHCKAVVVRS